MNRDLVAMNLVEHMTGTLGSVESTSAAAVAEQSKGSAHGVAALLHELLTGRMVYEEDNLPKLLDRVRKAEIPRPSKLRPSG